VNAARSLIDPGAPRIRNVLRSEVQRGGTACFISVVSRAVPGG